MVDKAKRNVVTEWHLSDYREAELSQLCHRRIRYYRRNEYKD